ncbi:MAG TPA: hypothetical protein VFK07_00510 [Candidatus Paceibacterota bacterium]|nr:hypothetical protein [Candidatus Paceibacterota bacterium]
MLRKIFIIVFLGSVLAVPSLADQVSSSQSFEYQFHLFLNNSNQLVVDHDFQFSYDILPQQFVQQSVGQSSYHGQVISLTGAVEGQFQFDVQQGKLSVEAPYAADAQKVIFYDPQNDPVLTLSVSESSYCNDDGVCDSERGENHLTCSNDCQASTLPVPSVAPTSRNSGGGSGLIPGLIYSLVGLALLAALWWFYKHRKGGSNPPDNGSGPDIRSLPKFKPLIPPSPPSQTPPVAEPPQKPADVDIPEIPRPGNPL